MVINSTDMRFHAVDLQARVSALGHNVGPIDGNIGPRTRGGASEAMEARGVDSWRGLFGPTGLSRIHWHWTGGADGVIPVEFRSYNGLVSRDGNRHGGQFPIEAQSNYAVGKAASHTLNANSTAIGLSCDAMAGAIERPFEQGSAPLTWVQLKALLKWSVELGAVHDIPISPFSMLSHAEIQPTLGIKQRWKWDITWLPDMERPGDAVMVGNRLREMMQDYIPQQKETRPVVPNEGCDQNEPEFIHP